jgi:hypothetical protein
MVETPLPRAEFPVADRYVYLNHAGVGPLPAVATAAIAAAAAAFRDDGGLVYEHYDQSNEDTRVASAALSSLRIRLWPLGSLVRL